MSTNKIIAKYAKHSRPLIINSLHTTHVIIVKTALTIKYTLFIKTYFCLLLVEYSLIIDPHAGSQNTPVMPDIT